VTGAGDGAGCGDGAGRGAGCGLGDEGGGVDEAGGAAGGADEAGLVAGGGDVTRGVGALEPPLGSPRLTLPAPELATGCDATVRAGLVEARDFVAFAGRDLGRDCDFGLWLDFADPWPLWAALGCVDGATSGASAAACGPP
jgi:hypothetical protein